MVFRAAILVAAVVLCSAVGCESKSDEAKGPHEYALAFGGIGWTWTVCLNDIPVLWEDRGGGQIPITGYVRNGENTLSIKAVKHDGGAILPTRLAVNQVPLGASGQAKAWSPVAQVDVSPEAVTETYEKTLTFAATVPVTWAWETADKLTSLSDTDRRAIASLILEFKTALAGKDLIAYKRLRQACLEETAKLHGGTLAEMTTEQELQLPEFFKGPVRVSAVDEGKLMFVQRDRVVYVRGPGDGTLIWVRPAAGEASESRPAVDVSWTYGPLLFAKIGVTWAIIN
jgi:hypothetical protein